MRAATIAAIVLAASAGAAHAETFCLDDWARKTAAVVQSLLDEHPAADRDVIKAPADVDPQMALAPPEARGALRVIRPPFDPEQR